MSLLKIAHVPPAKVETNTTVLDAVRVMAEEGVGAVAVMEKDQVCGIFTERDVMLRVVLKGRSPKETQVRDVMTSPVETTTEEIPSDEVLSFMVGHHIRHLPVVGKDGQLRGMLSIRNLLEYMVDDLQHEIHSMDQFLSNDGPGG